MTEAAPLLEARDLWKGFFDNPVLKGVSIEIRPGRVHALLGENGAGKSTLINLLSGVLQPDRGAITVAGRNPGALSPAQARALGIAVVQQELSLAPHLSVAENIALGAMPSRGGFIDFTTLAADAAALGRQLGLDVPLDLPVEALPLGRRQLVEIAKALWRRPKVLILDEPTSSLTGHEVRMLFGLLRELKRQGVAILYISHRLNEVLELCDWVTVLRDGVRTADQSLAGSDPAALVRLMVGRDPGDLFPRWRTAFERDRRAFGARSGRRGRGRGRSRGALRRGARPRRPAGPGPGGDAARALWRSPAARRGRHRRRRERPALAHAGKPARHRLCAGGSQA